MLTTLLYLSFVTLVSVGNLALGYGLALHLGHGPAKGWQALLEWGRTPATAVTEQTKPAEAHHGH
jgi:hypothetical protein